MSKIPIAAPPVKDAPGGRARPPGPAGHLISGSTPELRRDVLGFFTRCAREHGDLCAMRFYHLRAVLVSHPDLIERVLVAQNDRMVKAWDVRQLRMALGDGLLTSEGETWRRARALIQPAFHIDRIRRYAQVMAARAEAAAESWRDGQILDLHAEMMRLTLGIVAESLFGLEIEPFAPRVERALDEIMRYFERMFAGHIPGPLRFLTPGRWRAVRAVRRLDDVLLGILRERRASGAGGDDLLGVLIAARDEDGRPLSDRELRDHLVTLLMAGHETTALALSWSFYLLGRHPEAEARLEAELDDVLGDRTPGADDLGRLTYTRQVIRESLRLYPPAWGLGREAAREVELGGYRIARGAQIFMVPWVVHRDPRFFPEPERFRPERWSVENARPLPKYAYFPFGGGPRHCIGSGFAMAEATILLAVLARRWRFELVPGHPIELQPAVTLRPRYGIRAVARRR